METFLHDKSKQRYNNLYKQNDQENEKGKWNVIFSLFLMNNE